jgi:hypothetical protein
MQQYSEKTASVDEFESIPEKTRCLWSCQYPIRYSEQALPQVTHPKLQNKQQKAPATVNQARMPPSGAASPSLEYFFSEMGGPVMARPGNAPILSAGTNETLVILMGTSEPTARRNLLTF